MDLHTTGVRTQVILIWKYPDEFAASRRKRGRERNWQREWVNYHRYFFTMLSHQSTWRSVRYQDLARNSETLRQVCSWLGIPYFRNKEKYWTKDQLTVFGNDTTKIHLHDRDSKEFERHIKSITNGIGSADAAHKHHRSISYSADQTRRWAQPATQKSPLLRTYWNISMCQTTHLVSRTARRCLFRCARMASITLTRLPSKNSGSVGSWTLCAADLFSCSM